MDGQHPNERYRNQVKPALKSKIDELNMLGYGDIEEQQVWNYLVNKKWKKTEVEFRLFEVVADIMSINPGEFMNYTTVEAFRQVGLSPQDEDEWRELLK